MLRFLLFALVIAFVFAYGGRWLFMYLKRNNDLMRAKAELFERTTQERVNRMLDDDIKKRQKAEKKVKKR